VSLEEALKKEDLPGEDEVEDTAVLRRADLVVGRKLGGRRQAWF